MLQALGNLGLGNTQPQPSGLASLLTGGLKCTQNEQRLQQEKAQRNLLKKYLTQQSGDPIQSALISSKIPGKGYGDTFDVGLGTRSSIMQSLGLSQPAQSTGLLGSTPLLGNTLGLGNSTNTLGNLSALGGLSNLANGPNANPSLLGSLVKMAGTPNNNGNILNNLGGLGGGLFGNTGNTGGLLGNIQSGMNTLNTINKVNNAVSGVKGLFA